MKNGAICLVIVIFLTWTPFRPGALAMEKKETTRDSASASLDSLIQAAPKPQLRTVPNDLFRTQADSPTKARLRKAKTADDRNIIGFFEELATKNPTQASAHLVLGSVLLRDQRFEEAEKAFDRARRIDDSAESWFGLGMAAAAGDRSRKREAQHRFQEALLRNPKFSDARYQLALTLRALGNLGAEREMEKVLMVDPRYALAYLQLSHWAEEKPQGLELALKWCQRGLKATPDDPDLRVRLAELQIQNPEDQDQAIQLLMSRLETHPGDTDLLPAVAVGHMNKGRLEAARQAFLSYLDKVTPRERAYYEDISLVGTPGEVEAFRTLRPEMVPEYLRQFWTKRDLDLAEGVNRRELEHYRRVWVARTKFSEGRVPWDRRGEVHIRYGEPYFRQRSGERDHKKAMDPKVQAVRLRQFVYLYGHKALDTEKAMEALVVWLRRSLTLPVEDAAMDLVPGRYKHVTTNVDLALGPPYPLKGTGPGYVIVALGQSSSVAWESWVYPDIDGGTEFVFTDEYAANDFDLAPEPGLLGSRSFREHSPRAIFDRIKATSPSLYFPQLPSKPLTVYLASADFRASPEASRVELYLGVPSKEVTAGEEGWSCERTVVVYDKAWRKVHHSEDHSPVKIKTGADGEFVEEIGFDLAPAGYYVVAKVTDYKSGRAWLFRDSLQVSDYRGDSLRIGGLELASRIESSTEGGKFIKHDLRIIPKPSSTFRQDRGLSAYFEIYNLRQDIYGHTRYRIDYTVRKHEGGVGRLLLSGRGRLIGRKAKGDEITVSYELGGESVHEAAYGSLDLSHTNKGDYALKVTVTDQNSGMTHTKETGFKLQ